MGATLVRSGADPTKLPLAGGVVSGDILNSTAIRIGPNTSDASDNGSIVFGHSGRTRGGGITITGNEHASRGNITIIPGYDGATGSARLSVQDAIGSTIALFDGYSGITTITTLGTTNYNGASGTSTIAHRHSDNGTVNIVDNTGTSGKIGRAHV